MTTTRPGSLRRPPVAWGWLVLGSSLALGADAVAQHTPDPYNIVGEYNRQYEPYLYANVPTDPGQLPNENRSFTRGGTRNANQFQSMLDGDEDDGGQPGGSSRTPGGAGVPYYQAGRQANSGFQQQYQPNRSVDKEFYEQQRQRNADYLKARRETDPKKKAEMLRSYNQDKLRAARTLSSGRNLTSSERERGLDMDRVTTPRSLFGGDDDAEDAPPTGRRAATTEPRSGGTAASRTRGSAPTAAGRSTPGRSATGASSSRLTRPRGTGSAADVLRRSEAIDRASGSSAPPPPSGYLPR